MSRMFEEWFKGLFPKHNHDKVIDPYLWRCRCGYSWRFNRLQLLKMFLNDKYTHTCPKCLRKSQYRMISHVVRDIPSDDIIEYNKGLEL